MLTSTVTDKGQTTVPQKVREAMGVEPRQRLVWEVRKDGSAIVRPMPSVMELAGSLKSDVSFSNIRDETNAATTAWVSESLRSKRR
jgi:antitoxin PrlF